MESENVEPTYDDLADTITANLRTMRTMGIRMDKLATELSFLSLVLSVACVVAAVYLWQKVNSHG